ncbi:uncharacterized protein LOC118750436 [Rhagoletis pomonella]|uniref:uncharacterized protein LOC118750436 n=1 Tax=Rhagoletis pomonella TaxID=28610 RepID=UPI00177C1378|nr:uncharacterized protein LOC118750436 [Rhagoletis pomonella]
MANYKSCIISAQNALNELLESSSSSSEGEETSILFSREERTHVKDFIVDVVCSYTDAEFRKHFRVRRESANYLIAKYSSSTYHAKRTYRGGRAEFSHETQILMFLWFCSNKTTFREVGNLFNMSL